MNSPFKFEGTVSLLISARLLPTLFLTFIQYSDEIYSFPLAYMFKYH